MHFNPQSGNHGDDGDDRRGFGRLSIDGVVRCAAGQVDNLSISGCRVLAKKKPQVWKLMLEVWDNQTAVTVPAELVRCEKIGFRKYDLGYRFADLTPEQSQALTRISMANRTRRTIKADGG